MRLAGLILALGVIVLAALNGGSVGLFMDIGSIVIVAGITFGGLLGSGSSIRLLFRALFGASISDEQLRAAIDACARARTYAMVSGWFGFVMGLIILGALLTDIKALGPGFGLCLITVFYGMVVSYIVLLPLQNRLEDRMQKV